MHRKSLLFGCMLAIVLFMIGSALQSTPAQAENLLQGVPMLTGYKIYFTEANGEASRFDRGHNGVSRLAGLLVQLGAELGTLEWRTGIPDDAELIIIAGLTSDLGPNNTARLWAYLDSDASVLLLADPITGSGRNAVGVASTAGLFNLMWSDIGMRVRDDAVVTEDTSGEIVQLIESFGAANFDANHQATAETEGELVFSRARSVEIDGSLQTFVVTPLVFSPNNFYGEMAFNDYLTTDLVEYNIGTDITRGPLVVAASAENPATNTRIALIGDRDFALNGGGFQTSPPTSAAFLYPENSRFLLRLIGWLLNADATTTYEFDFPTAAPTGTATLTPTPVITDADLMVTIAANTTTPQENEALIYTLTLTNNGPDTATGINVTTLLPPEVTFVSATASTRRGYNNTTGIWDAESLENGASATLNIVVSVNPESNGSVITLTSTVNAAALNDIEPSNNTSSVEVTVTEAEATETP